MENNNTAPEEIKEVIKPKSFFEQHHMLIGLCAVLFVLVMYFVFSIAKPGSSTASLTSAIPNTYAGPYYQYPSLSDSGFYLEYTNNPKAKDDVNTILDKTASHINTLITGYYSSCINSTSATCVSRTNAITNAIYTYATYAVAAERLARPSITTEADWAGIAAFSVNKKIMYQLTATTMKSFLANLKTEIHTQFISAVDTQTFQNNSPLASTVVSNLKTVLNNKRLTTDSTLIGSTVSNIVFTPKGPTGQWKSIASSADGTKVVGVMQNGQIYTSTDSGLTWTARESARYWNSISSSADGSTLLATVAGSSTYISTDSGLTWTMLTLPVPTFTSTYISTNGKTIIGTVSRGPLYISLDTGATWKVANPTITNYNGVAMSYNGGTIAAAVGGGKIYVSKDSGVSWTPRATARTWQSIASSIDGINLVATVSNGQIYVSNNSGETWTAKDSIRQWRQVTSSSDGTKLAATVYGGQIYTSIDNGATWTAKDSARTWIPIAMSADGSKIFAGVSNGQIYVSSTTSSETVVPYRIVFGPDEIGNMQFKILNNGDVNNMLPFATYSQINVTVAETDKTRTIIDAIASNMAPATIAPEELVYAVIANAMAEDYASAPAPVDSGEIFPTVQENIEGLYCAFGIPYDPTGGNDAVILSQIKECPDPVATAPTQARAATDEIGMSSIQKLELKMSELARTNNNFLEGLLVVSVEFNSGDVYGFKASLMANDQAGFLAEALADYKGSIKKVYNERFDTHDMYAFLLQYCWSNHLTSSSFKDTVPYSTDFARAILFEKKIQSSLGAASEVAIPLVNRVFGINGKGYEFSIPKTANLYNVYDNFPVGPVATSHAGFQRSMDHCIRSTIGYMAAVSYQTRNPSPISSGGTFSVVDMRYGLDRYLDRLRNGGMTFTPVVAGQ